MNRKNCIPVSLAALAFIAAPAVGQNNAPGVPYDWSHHHVIFSPPSTQEQQTGATADRRYWHQWTYRNLQHTAPDEQDSINGQVHTAVSSGAPPAASSNAALSATPSALKTRKINNGLWEMNMGAGATVGQGNYPAKFSFTTSSALCAGAPQPDFVVYNTGLVGLNTSQATIIAFDNLYSGCTVTRTGLHITANSGSTSIGYSAGVITTADIGSTITDTTSGHSFIPAGTTITAVTTPVAASLTSNSFNSTTTTANFGQTISVNGVTLTANTARAEVNRIGFGGTAPSNNASVTVAGIAYVFKTANWTSGTEGASQCFIRTSATTSNMVSWLASAITTGAANTGSSTNTWECNAASGSQPSAGVTVTGSTSPNVDVTAKIVGATGFTATSTGTNAPSVSITLTGSDAVNAGATFFTVWSGAAGVSAATLGANIVTAINNNSATTLSTAALAGAGPFTITVTASTPGTAGNGINVGSTFTGFSWPAPGHLQNGVDGATISNATTGAIVATDSITITPPAGKVPNVFWSYNTDTSGTDNSKISTSVILSLDGSQVAFVHSNASGSSLVLLNWKAGDGVPAGSATNAASAAVKPANQYAAGAASSYIACAANTSCQLTLPFSGTTANVTRSSPFVNYNTGELYVGDDNGVLHKFVNIFNGGIPAEVTTGGWPLTVSSAAGTGKILTSAVLDLGTHNIYVADFAGVLRFVKDVGSTLGSCAAGSPPCLASATQTPGGPIVEGPMIDSTTQRVFASTGVTGAIASYKIFQTDEALTTAQNKSITFAGASGRSYNSYPHLGAFDNIYYATGVSSGHLYFCAPDTSGSFFNAATLYQIGFNASGVMNTSTGGSLTMQSPSVANGASVDDCSPLTEFYNGTTDFLYAGVAQNGNITGCAGSTTNGCLYNFDITSGTMPSDSVAGRVSAAGTSGIVIDNTASSGGSQIYFTPLADSVCTGVSPPGAPGNGTGGCATQATQAALN